MSIRLFDQLPDIEKQLRGATHWLVGLDFDGTLAPIVADPLDAELDLRLRPLLQSIAALPNVTPIIVSGRARADVEARVGIPELIYAGNHGLDIHAGELHFLEPTAAASLPALNAMATAMADKLSAIPGTIVEHKGLTLSVHYRMVDESLHEEVRRQVHSVLALTDHPFVLTMGKRVFEIRPRTSWNKGAAIVWIRDHICPNASVLYIGDDQTDEDAFRVCAEGIAIRVGRSETTVAGYYLDNQAQVFDFLAWLPVHM